MSLTMQHIISDAQSLCTRLKDRESLADRLIAQAQALYKQVDAMKQYKEEAAELNEAAHQKPRDVLVQGIQQDNRHLRELQQENKELRSALEEHQNTLEVIMSKYRKQVTQLMQMNKADRDVTRAASHRLADQSGQTALAEVQSEKIREMAAVMRHACTLDQHGELAAGEYIAQLSQENRGLRELLRVGYSYNADLMAAAGPLPIAPASTAAAAVSENTPAACGRPAGGGTSPHSPQTGFQTVRRRLPTAAAPPVTTVVLEEEADAEDDDGTEGSSEGEGKEVGGGEGGRVLSEEDTSVVGEVGAGMSPAKVVSQGVAKPPEQSPRKLVAQSPPVVPPQCTRVTSSEKSPVSPQISKVTSLEKAPLSIKVTSPEKSPVSPPLSIKVTSPEKSPVSPLSIKVTTPEKSSVSPAQSSKVTSPENSAVSPPQSGKLTSPEKSPVSPPQSGKVTSPEKSPQSVKVTSPGKSPQSGKVTSPEKSAVSPQSGKVTSPENSPVWPQSGKVTSPEKSLPESGKVIPPEKTPTKPGGQAIKVIVQSPKSTAVSPKAKQTPPYKTSASPKTTPSSPAGKASPKSESPKKERPSGPPTWCATSDASPVTNGPASEADGSVTIVTEDTGSESDTSEASVVSQVERQT